MAIISSSIHATRSVKGTAIVPLRDKPLWNSGCLDCVIQPNEMPPASGVTAATDVVLLSGGHTGSCALAPLKDT